MSLSSLQILLMEFDRLHHTKLWIAKIPSVHWWAELDCWSLAPACFEGSISSLKAGANATAKIYTY